MRTGKKAASLAVAVSVLLLWVVASAGARPVGDVGRFQEGSSIDAATSPSIQYQARLIDPGTGDPVPDGTYTMVFRLYDVATEGVALWTETKDVPVQGGLFSTALGDTAVMSQDIFNGQQLWLGVKVGSDPEATPRQLIRPAAYALGLVPGAIVQANSALPVLRVHNTGAGEALHVEGAASVAGNLSVSGSLTGGAHAHSAADITSGTFSEAVIDAAIARDSEVISLVLSNDGSGSTLDADLFDKLDSTAFARTVHAHSGGDITTGTVLDARIDSVVARDSEVMSIVTGADGSGSTLDADRLDALDSTAFARTAHAHSGGDITTGTVLDARIDGVLARDSEVMGIVTGADGSGSTLNADYLDSLDSAAFARTAHNHWGNSWTGTGTGLTLASTDHIGLSSSGEWYGVWGETQEGSAGVIGYAPNAAASNYGVWGFTYSTTSGGTGVRGQAAGASGTTYAVYGQNNSTAGYGVYGNASASSGTTYGVYGRASSPSGYGVYGSSPDGYGVYGETTGTTDYAVAMYAQSASASGRGVYSYASANSASTIAVIGSTYVSTNYGFYTPNRIYAGNGCIGCTAMYIATNTSQETLLAGDAVVAVAVGQMLQGHSAPVLEVRRATSEDVSVLGVVQGRGQLFPASEEEAQLGDIVQAVEGDVQPGDYVLIVTSGLAQVRVAPGLTTLAPGASLAVAGSAGRATVAGADTETGLIFAQAVEVEPDANGLVWAMIGSR